MFQLHRVSVTGASVYSPRQKTDGRSRRRATCDERFWLARWKFANSNVPAASPVTQHGSIHLQRLGFRGEGGAIGGWRHTAVASAISRFQLAFRVAIIFLKVFLFRFFFSSRRIKFVNVSAESWPSMESSPHTFTNRCRRGLLGPFHCFFFVFLFSCLGVSETWSATSASRCRCQNSRLLLFCSTVHPWKTLGLKYLH